MTDVHRLRLSGALPAARYLDAMGLVRDGAAWRRWAGRVLLALAVGQLVAAVVFFFAFNWQALPGLVKIGGTLVVTLACGGAALVVRQVLARQAVLVATAMMTGVTLAVFGQHYQTGADAWQLFALWGLLILPYTVLGGGPVLWLVWAVVVQVGLGLADDALGLGLSLAAFAVLPAAFVLAREARSQVVPRWLALLAQVVVLLIIGWKATAEVTGGLLGGDALPWGLPALITVGVISWLGPWLRRRDLAPLALSACAVGLVVAAALFRHVEGMAGMTLATALVAGMFAGMVSLLNHLRKRAKA